MNLKLGVQGGSPGCYYSKLEMRMCCAVLSIRENLLREQFFVNHVILLSEQIHIYAYRSNKCLLALIFANVFEIANFFKIKRLVITAHHTVF